MAGRKTKRKVTVKVISWKGKAEELFICFVKGFHVIKFKVLNLSPILLIVSLEETVLTTDFTAFALYSLMTVGDGAPKENIYIAVHPFK